jgi:hypothetical protein
MRPGRTSAQAAAVTSEKVKELAPKYGKTPQQRSAAIYRAQAGAIAASSAAAKANEDADLAQEYAKEAADAQKREITTQPVCIGLTLLKHVTPPRSVYRRPMLATLHKLPSEVCSMLNPSNLARILDRRDHWLSPMVQVRTLRTITESQLAIYASD